ncbi:MAG TPA: hypothetical protein VGO09_02565, partial [Flavisolibacter sp.]|nr:hypothetical protein [Flavisolibacter sp.]
ADKYEIERSIDGSNWNTIAYVMASGSTNNVNNYSYTDKNINANVIYYRIKQVDNGGSFTYTIIETLKTAITNSGIEVKIASADHKVILQFSQEVKSNVVVRFISFGGQVISQQTVNQPMGQVVLNADASLRGNYIVSVSNNQDLNTARQIIL